VIYEMDHPRAKKEWILTAVTRSRSLDRILVYTGYLPRKLSAINQVVCTRDESDVDLDVVRGFLKDVCGKSAEPHPDPARTVWDPFKKIWLKDNQEAVQARRKYNETHRSGRVAERDKLKSNREKVDANIRIVRAYVAHHRLTRIVAYRHGRNRTDGRLYAHPSVQSLPSAVRDAALSPRCRDDDLDTAHQCCLRILYLARGLKVPPQLDEYVTNKVAIREMLAQHYATSTKAAKEYVNAATYSQDNPRNCFFSRP